MNRSVYVPGMNKPQRIIEITEYEAHFEVRIDEVFDRSFHKPNWNRKRLDKEYKLDRDNWKWIHWCDMRGKT